MSVGAVDWRSRPTDAVPAPVAALPARGSSPAAPAACAQAQARHVRVQGRLHLPPAPAGHVVRPPRRALGRLLVVRSCCRRPARTSGVCVGTFCLLQDVDKWFRELRLKVVSVGDELFIRLYDQDSGAFVGHCGGLRHSLSCSRGLGPQHQPDLRGTAGQSRVRASPHPTRARSTGTARCRRRSAGRPQAPTWCRAREGARRHRLSPPRAAAAVLASAQPGRTA